MTWANLMKSFSRLFCAIALVSLTGCADVPTDPEERAAFEANNDPLEPMNREIFDFNLKLDRHVLKPVAVAYRDHLPQPAQDGVRNAADNLGEPMTFVNETLQARIADAATTFARLFINSTLGLGGLFDVAGNAHIEKKEADFGQTLYVWGIKHGGPYLVLPFVGIGSNPRDTFGSAVDTVGDPVGLAASNNGLIGYDIGMSALSIIDRRARNIDTLDELEKSSLDFYAKIRSITRQRRNAQLGIKEDESLDYLADPDAK